MSAATLLYGGPHYEACWIDGPHGGLCVTRKRARGGVKFPDAGGVWREALATAIDDDERHALCRAILQERV